MRGGLSCGRCYRRVERSPGPHRLGAIAQRASSPFAGSLVRSSADQADERSSELADRSPHSWPNEIIEPLHAVDRRPTATAPTTRLTEYLLSPHPRRQRETGPFPEVRARRHDEGPLNQLLDGRALLINQDLR